MQLSLINQTYQPDRRYRRGRLVGQSDQLGGGAWFQIPRIFWLPSRLQLENTMIFGAIKRVENHLGMVILQISKSVFNHPIRWLLSHQRRLNLILKDHVLHVSQRDIPIHIKLIRPDKGLHELSQISRVGLRAFWCKFLPLLENIQ